MSTKTLFLIRTNAFDLNSRLLGHRLSSVAGVQVVFIADERKGIVDTGAFAKITSNESALASLGIHKLPADWGWFCGDMCYYLAANVYPDFDRYTLIESDVYIPENGVLKFINQLHDCHSDFIAYELGPTAKPKRFSRDLEKLGLDPAWGCLFPISRVSRNFVEVMQALRIRSLESNLRINDEAIMCGAIQKAHATYTPLELAAPDVICADTFDTNPPHLLDALYANENDARIYHPAVSFEKVIERIYSNEKRYDRHRLRRVLKAAEGLQRKAILNTLKQHGPT